MKLFLSYPSAQRGLAERLALALEGEGHEVFIDRTDLKAGEAFHQRLRESIQAAEALVFLITPESVAPGSYALAELNIAQQRWRRPAGKVLPVMVVPTPIAALPAWLAAVTVLAPRGDTVAEVVAAVALLAPQPSGRGRKIAIGAAVTVAALAALVAAGWWQAEQRSVERARLAAAQAVSQAVTARQLCDDGSHDAAMSRLNQLAAPSTAPAGVLAAREDCAMRWLREMRATTGVRTFGDQVALVEPVLLQGLARSSGSRSADLRAHLGWGEYLRGRDGKAVHDPVPHWKRALEDDAGNPYAHAMWARRLLDAPVDLPQARRHFTEAVSAQRDPAFVRSLQLGGAVGGSAELNAYAVTVADEMRRRGESIEPIHRRRLWTHVFGTAMLEPKWRATLAALVAPADLLTTFLWLFPDSETRDEQRALWRFSHASLLAASGDAAAARSGFASLVAELRGAKSAGPLLDQSQLALDRLAPAGAAQPAPRRGVPASASR